MIANLIGEIVRPLSLRRTHSSPLYGLTGLEAKQVQEIITYHSILEKLQQHGVEGMLVNKVDALFVPYINRTNGLPMQATATPNQVNGYVQMRRRDFFPELNPFLSQKEKDFLFTQLLKQMSLSSKSGVTQATGPDAFGFFELGYDPVVRGNAIQMLIERIKGHHGYYSAPVVLQFNSDKDIICNEPIPLGRFCLPIGDPIRGHELQALIDTNCFPEGSEVIYIEGSPVVKVPITKYYKIGADLIDLHEIARIRAKERGKLDKLLQLIEKSKDSLKLFAQDGNPHYLLAEADYLSIPQQYHFVMFTYAKTSSGRAFSRHLPSFLLDAGYEGALRVELSYQVEIPEFVYIEAYKAVVM